MGFEIKRETERAGDTDNQLDTQSDVVDLAGASFGSFSAISAATVEPGANLYRPSARTPAIGQYQINDCVPACIAQVVRSVGFESLTQLEAGSLLEQGGYRAKDGMTKMIGAESILRGHGIDVRYYENISLDNVVQQVE